MSMYTGAVNFYEAMRGRGVLGHMVMFDDTGMVTVHIGDRENSWATMRHDLDVAQGLGATVTKILDNEQGEVWMTTLGTPDVVMAMECLTIALVDKFGFERGRNAKAN